VARKETLDSRGGHLSSWGHPRPLRRESNPCIQLGELIEGDLTRSLIKENALKRAAKCQLKDAFWRLLMFYW
jgi:hypothetical protein